MLRSRFFLALCLLLISFSSTSQRTSVLCADGLYHQQGYCPADLSSPSSANVGETSADGTVSVDRDDGTLYMCVTTSSTPLTAAQIIACSGGTAVVGASDTLSASGSQSLSATGLSSSTSYYNQFVHMFSLWPSDIVVSSAYTTSSSATPPNDLVANCALTAHRCVGDGDEYDTTGETDEQVRQTIDAAISAASPGDYILLRGGTYIHDVSSASDFYADLDVSGTSGNPIRFRSYPGEWAIIHGWDADPENASDSNEDDQRLVYITGDYVEVSHLEVRESTGTGIEVLGSYGHVHHTWVHDTWFEGIRIGYGNVDVTENIIEYNIQHESFDRYGIAVYRYDGGTWTTLNTNNTIRYNIAFRNGYWWNGSSWVAVTEGAAGGNSDGFFGYKNCHDFVGTYNASVDPDVGNLCPGQDYLYNITWGNADDGFDTTVGDGSRLWGNISFNNGPEGGRGFKVLRYTGGALSFIGNIAYSNYQNTSNDGTGIESRTATGYDPTVMHNLMLDHTASNGLVVLNSTSFTSDTNISNNISDDGVATSGGATQNDNLTTSLPAKYTTFSADLSCAESFSVSGGNPLIEDCWQSIYDEHVAQYELDVADAEVDNGTFVSGVHCASADDVSDPDCWSWSGSAPDRGPYEYGIARIDLSSLNIPTPTLAGFGTGSSFGNDGETCTVTSTADTGASGTFRDCVENRSASGDSPTPRTIEFATTGTIILTSDLRIRQPYLTIDGFSAADPGITIETSSSGQFGIGTSSANSTCGHDVLIQGLRFQGQWPRDTEDHSQNADNLNIDGEDYLPGGSACITNVAIWRNTLIDGEDQVAGMWGGMNNITVAYNYFLYNYHPFQISHTPNGTGQQRENISVHNNVFAYFHDRGANVRGDVRSLNLRQNIWHEWDAFGFGGGYAVLFRSRDGTDPVDINMIDNVFTGTSGDTNAAAIGWADGADQAEVYTSGNTWPVAESQRGTAVSEFSNVDGVSSVSDIATEMLPFVGMPYRTSEESTIMTEVEGAL